QTACRSSTTSFFSLFARANARSGEVSQRTAVAGAAEGTLARAQAAQPEALPSRMTASSATASKVTASTVAARIGFMRPPTMAGLESDAASAHRAGAAPGNARGEPRKPRGKALDQAGR